MQSNFDGSFEGIPCIDMLWAPWCSSTQSFGWALSRWADVSLTSKPCLRNRKITKTNLEMVCCLKMAMPSARSQRNIRNCRSSISTAWTVPPVPPVPSNRLQEINLSHQAMNQLGIKLGNQPLPSSPWHRIYPCPSCPKSQVTIRNIDGRMENIPSGNLT